MSVAQERAQVMSGVLGGTEQLLVLSGQRALAQVVHQPDGQADDREHGHEDETDEPGADRETRQTDTPAGNQGILGVPAEAW